MAIQADVADRAAVNAMVAAAEAAFGPVTLLVNNAGISRQGLFQDVDDELWDRYFAVNVCVTPSLIVLLFMSAAVLARVSVYLLPATNPSVSNTHLEPPQSAIQVPSTSFPLLSVTDTLLSKLHSVIGALK